MTTKQTTKQFDRMADGIYRSLSEEAKRAIQDISFGSVSREIFVGFIASDIRAVAMRDDGLTSLRRECMYEDSPTKLGWFEYVDAIGCALADMEVES